MPKIKLVLSDVDGTLVPITKHTVSLVIIDAVGKVQAKGIEIVAVTGRPFEMMQDLFKQIGFHDLCIVDAGASIRKVETGEIVWKNWLDMDRLKAIATILLPVSDIIDFFPEWREPKASTLTIDDIKTEAPYVFAFVLKSARDRVREELKSIPNITVHEHESIHENSEYYALQVVDHEADKYHAVIQLRKILAIDKVHTLGIGDSSNDLPLLEAAGVKVAMGNAIPSLKAIADHVVASVEQDGFAEAMERFVLTGS